ncbi:MAG TPA: cytochrome c family protein [Hyphomicrobiaceae bacterium]|nr:cytochrome c family protein [Hyphomicrobiaceae bacterium]
MRKWILAAGLMMIVPTMASAADATNGANVFKKCKACHDVSGKNKVGPHLNGVVGRKAGAVEGFKYSDAMKNSGITWNEAELDKYLKDPKADIPGNKMVFVGIKDDADRADLVAYLATQK